jgi:ParB family transcriptional regulator, chromosome partitioning protein
VSLTDHSLGRSLGDVLAKTMRREPSKGYLEIDLGLIRPPAANPRTAFDPAALDDLAASLRQHGMLQPIVVLRRDVGLSGERRWRAAQIAGLAKVPVVVRDEADPQHVAELRLVENIQRQDLNPVELGRAYQALIDTHGLTHDQVADRVSKSRPSITHALRILALPEAILAQVATGALGLGHAKALLACTDPAWQAVLAERAVAGSITVRDLERLAAGAPTPAIATRGTVAAPGKPPHVRELEENLLHLFGTRVGVRERADGRGTITLHFDNREHFKRVVAIMDRFLKQAGRDER